VPELLPVAPRTGSGEQSFYLHEPGDELSLFLNVLGIGVSVAVSLAWSENNTDWHVETPLESLPTVTTSGKWVKRFPIKGPYCKASYTCVGTTTFGLRYWVW
jgi:hypothetical protein